MDFDFAQTPFLYQSLTGVGGIALARLAESRPASRDR